MRGGWGEKLPIIGGVLVAALFLAAFVVVDEVQESALALLQWMERLGGLAILLYFGLYVAIVLLIVPGIVFTLGAGFLFGFWLGGAVIVGALATGSSLAFLIARYAFGEGLSRRIREHPRVGVLNRALRHEGWKIVLLSRFLPIFPFKLSNYFFGLTAMPFRHFFFANLVGVIPISLTNVYVGSLTAELADLTEREPQSWEWVLYGAGFVAAVGIVYTITRIARRAMRQAIEEEEEREEDV